jgi:hypothetical protein
MVGEFGSFQTVSCHFLLDDKAPSYQPVKMLLQSVMAKAYFAQKRGETPGLAVFERNQNAFVKEVHYGLK